MNGTTDKREMTGAVAHAFHLSASSRLWLLPDDDDMIMPLVNKWTI